MFGITNSIGSMRQNLPKVISRCTHDCEGLWWMSECDGGSQHNAIGYERETSGDCKFYGVFVWSTWWFVSAITARMSLSSLF
jgi:hypothetical protein